MLSLKAPGFNPWFQSLLSEATCTAYNAALLAKYLDDPANLFIVSSDFCHWGKRFNYTPWDKTKGPLHKAIEDLDRVGMRIIEAKDPEVGLYKLNPVDP